MSDASPSRSPVVVVTGANGLVGARTCAALADLGAGVRAIVRRPGAAPALPGVQEHVGDFHDPDLAAAVVDGATAVVTTVHPLGADRGTQQQVAVEGTSDLARIASDAGVARLVHISTAAVYDRTFGAGDIDESSALVGDDGGAYPTTKRDTDRALAEVGGITRVIIRPPAILGPGPTSVWNTVYPTTVRDDEDARRDTPERTFAWVHVDDLARFVAGIAVGAVPAAADPDDGPVADGVTAVNLAGEPATARDYLGTVAAALGVDPVWVDEPVWTGALVTARARRWGWTPAIGLGEALEELREGLSEVRGGGRSRGA